MKMSYENCTKEFFDNLAKETVAAKETEKGRKLRVYIQTFGCQQNEADSERLLGMAKEIGYEETDMAENADLIIYNTCAVREHAELRSLSKTGLLKKLKENNKELIIGLWGCMVSQEHRQNDIKYKYPYVSFVAGTNMLARFTEILCDVMINKRRRYYVDLSDETIVEGLSVCRKNDIKAWVSIMYGCDNYCTYCVVPYVRGHERSRRPADILSEVRQLVCNGYKEITLLGQNVNSYGKGLAKEESISFAGLLSEICKIEGDFIVRFMTSHPKDLSDELIETIASNPKIERHFHLPMQAGNDRVLAKMNRKYTSQEFLSKAQKLKEKVPGIAITSDIICGFPTETDEEFEDTLEMIKTVEFDAVFAFIFSPRRGTPAEKMEDFVTHEEKTARFARLTELQAKISRTISEGYIGKTIRVLCDSKEVSENGYFCGRDSRNREIFFTSEKNADMLYGKFINVRVTDTENIKIIGKEVKE